MQPDVEMKAYHEAGHAVVALKLGLSVEYVHIDLSAGTSTCRTGYVDYAALEARDLNIAAEKDCICSRADELV